MDHVQEHLENPFDGLGEDDGVDLDTVEFYAKALSPTPIERAA
jgi:hypothetical protein